MPKKLILVLGLSFFLLSCRVAFAGLIINEIMYDLSGSDSVNSKSREWVEVYNSGSDEISVDASKWRIYDGSGNRTINGEVNFSFPPGSYIIFAGDKDTFLNDHSGFSGTVYDTGITSLNNTGATLKILDQDGNVVNEITYASSQGANGDGNSLQLVNGSWVAAAPTPGAINAASPSGGGGGSTVVTVGPTITHEGSPLVVPEGLNVKVVKAPNMQAKILADTSAFAGEPLEIKTEVLGFSNEKVVLGRADWNFGDGGSYEQVNNFKKFAHIYYYPGEYVLFLEYYQNTYSKTPDATSQMTIKVLPTTVTISKVGDAKDFFVELSNNAASDIDISGWALKANGKIFTLPKNSLILSKKQMTIPGLITGFTSGDQSDLKLFSSTGELVFNYSASAASVASKMVIAKTTKLPSLAEVPLTLPVSNPNINLASAVSSNIVEDGGANNPRTTIIFIVSAILVGLAAYAVYFIRRKRVVAQPGSDFEILDE